MAIDSRLLDCNTQAEIEANYNRVLALIDTLTGIAKVSVTFDSDGGSAVSSQLIKYNTVATEPTAPTKDGFTFAGWYNGETEFVFTTPITADITLTATWE